MSDDADPTYSAATNQMAEGHTWIFNTFGVVPRYGWHIGTYEKRRSRRGEEANRGPLTQTHLLPPIARAPVGPLAPASS